MSQLRLSKRLRPIDVWPDKLRERIFEVLDAIQDADDRDMLPFNVAWVRSSVKDVNRELDEMASPLQAKLQELRDKMLPKREKIDES